MSKRARKPDAAAGAASMRNESAKIVKLNVGGTKFTTLLSTLRAVPGSVLDHMFDEEAKYGEPIRDEDGNVFLDTDPEAFPVVLNFLRFGSYVEGKSMPAMLANKVEAAADYFGLSRLVEELQDPPGANDSAEMALVSLADDVKRLRRSTTESIVPHLAGIAESLFGMADSVGGVSASLETIKDSFEGRISESKYSNQGNAFRTTDDRDNGNYM